MPNNPNFQEVVVWEMVLENWDTTHQIMYTLVKYSKQHKSNLLFYYTNASDVPLVQLYHLFSIEQLMQIMLAV